MARLVHLNGPPGVGKTTLARQYAEDHPGTLLCDVDQLRTLISGWQHDAEAAGHSRAIALAMIRTYLQTGRDVVLPQLVAREDQLARFVRAAEECGGRHIHVMLTAPPDVVVSRFRERAVARDDPWTAYATAYWDGIGGDDAIRELDQRLRAMDAVRVRSTSPDETYARLLDAVEGDGRREVVRQP